MKKQFYLALLCICSLMLFTAMSSQTNKASNTTATEQIIVPTQECSALYNINSISGVQADVSCQSCHVQVQKCDLSEQASYVNVSASITNSVVTRLPEGGYGSINRHTLTIQTEDNKSADITFDLPGALKRPHTWRC